MLSGRQSQGLPDLGRRRQYDAANCGRLIPRPLVVSRLCSSVHVIVGADVDERHPVGRKDEDDAILAGETGREAVGERSVQSMGHQASACA
jgi:hypothetical protein